MNEKEQDEELRTKRETREALHKKIDDWLDRLSWTGNDFNDGTESKMEIYVGCESALWSARVSVTDTEVL